MDPKKIYLAQTDTTVGLLSQDAKRLAKIKKRSPKKPFLIALVSLRILDSFVRVPIKHKKRVRRAKKSTFVYPNGKAIRLVDRGEHYRFLRRFGWMYSTSANESGKGFDRVWAQKVADVIVEDRRGLYEGKPSRIFWLSHRRIVKIR